MTRVILDAPMIFAGQHAPMVTAGLGDTPTRLILDTGATHHLLTVELSDAFGLTRTAVPSGTDHAGAPVSSWALGQVTVRLATESILLEDVIAIPSAPAFSQNGIGGVLSPQCLHPTAHVVLDMAGRRLILLEGRAPDVVSWIRDRNSTYVPRSLDRMGDDRLILVQAAIEPHEAVPTLLNTGGKETEFAADAVSTLSGAPLRERGHGLSGQAVRGFTVDDQVLIVGGMRIAVPTLLVRANMGRATYAGDIGMDVLRSSILVVNSDNREPVLWFAPEQDNESSRWP